VKCARLCNYAIIETSDFDFENREIARWSVVKYGACNSLRTKSPPYRASATRERGSLWRSAPSAFNRGVLALSTPTIDLALTISPLESFPAYKNRQTRERVCFSARSLGVPKTGNNLRELAKNRYPQRGIIGEFSEIIGTFGLSRSDSTNSRIPLSLLRFTDHRRESIDLQNCSSTFMRKFINL